MRLVAISKFFWRGHEHEVGDVFDADEVKGPLLVAEGHAKVFDAPPNDAAAIHSVPLVEPTPVAGDARESTTAKSKSKTKKK